MARILVSFPSTIYDRGRFAVAIFYDGFLRSLVQCGNDVRVINTAEFLSKPWHGYNEINLSLNGAKLVEDVKQFDPELIIAFNHSIPRAVVENTNCPVALWDADSIAFYNDVDYIRAHMERYLFMCFSQRGVKSAIEFGADKSRVAFIPAGTAVQAEDIDIAHNISFIGSHFRCPKSFIDLMRAKTPPVIKPVMEKLTADFFGDHEQTLRDMNAEYVSDYIKPVILASLSSVQNRNALLNDLCDLGLAIYGDDNWYDVGEYLPTLALAYQAKKVYSLKHNQDIYNGSKICINISHAQAVDGFPWRVMDIMASNGALVSDRKSGLGEFTKGFVDIPMYDNRREAFDICQKLLKDDAWRRDIVEGSQKCIEERGRWDLRIRDIGEFTGIRTVTPVKDNTQAQARINAMDLKDIFYESDKYRRFFSRTMDEGAKFLIRALPRPLLSFVGRTLVLLRISVPYRYFFYVREVK